LTFVERSVRRSKGKKRGLVIGETHQSRNLQFAGLHQTHTRTHTNSNIHSVGFSRLKSREIDRGWLQERERGKRDSGVLLIRLLSCRMFGFSKRAELFWYNLRFVRDLRPFRPCVPVFVRAAWFCVCMCVCVHDRGCYNNVFMCAWYQTHPFISVPRRVVWADLVFGGNFQTWMNCSILSNIFEATQKCYKSTEKCSTSNKISIQYFLIFYKIATKTYLSNVSEPVWFL